MTPWRKRVILWGGVLSALVGTPVWLYHHLDLDDPFDDSSFDRAAWIQHAHSDDDNPRGHMVESLIDQLKDERPMRAEVIELLGPYGLTLESKVPRARAGVRADQLNR